MHISLAADRRRVAERFGDRLDHRLDADPRISGLLKQLIECDRTRAPGAEMLRGEISARRAPDIFVHLARGDMVQLAARSDKLVQHLARQLVEPPDDAFKISAGDSHLPDDSGLGREAHHQLVALAREMAPAQSRGAEALILARI